MINAIQKYSSYASRLLTLSLDKFRQDGLAGFLQACSQKVLGVLNKQSPSADQDFDRGFGTDTAGIIPIWKMDIDSAAKKHGNRYQASDPTVFRELIAELPIDPKDFTFIDLGSGKGRALLLASMTGFRQAIGVEFSKELFDVSNENIDLYRARYPNSPPIECRHQDAGEFAFPDMDIVVYLYNPFGETVLRVVKDNILQAYQKYDREIYIVYFNNEHDQILFSDDGIHLLRSLRNASVYECQSPRV